MNKLYILSFKSIKINLSLLQGVFVAILFLVYVTSCNRDKDYQQPKPIISSFSPTSGLPTTDNVVGTTVTVSGDNFSTTVSDNRLYFNGELATIISATKNELVTTVPKGATTGKLMISTNNKSNSSTSDFTVIPYPIISSLAPLTGATGRTVTITGANFDANVAGNIVKFNGTIAVVNSAITTQLVTTVPTGATTGKISVKVNGATTLSNLEFIVLPSTVITSFAPTSGVAGTSVTITGVNFSSTPLLNTVKFGEVAAVVNSASATQLVVTVPAGSVTGKITVAVNDVTVFSENNFVVPNSPLITSFSPSMGMAGTNVTLVGNNFSSIIANNTVKFNDVIASVSAASSTQLTVAVPSNATSGKITVSVGGLTAYSENDFTVVFTPTITSFAPISGIVGTTVTITGTNFSSTASDNIVKFNSTTATVTTATATQLVVNVPTSATTGKISIATNGQTVTSANDFTVIQLSTINSFSPTSGIVSTTVTITGTNFSTTAANNIVKFNSTIATVTSATSTQLVATVTTGTTTGKISITTNGQTVTSASDFTITPSLTITSFTGTDYISSTIGITGTNFSTTPVSNVVRFKGTVATVISATATNLLVKVPTGATDGRITVTVDGVTATTASDFIVKLPYEFQLQPVTRFPGLNFFDESQYLRALYLQPGFYDFKFNNVKVGQFQIDDPGPNPPSGLMQFEFTLPASASGTKAKLLVERWDGVIVATSQSELEILKPIPSTGLTAQYLFYNDLELFGSTFSTAKHLNHNYLGKALPTFTADRFGNANRAISFNGNQAGTTTTNMISGKPWTISFWINYGALPQDVFNNGGISSVSNNIGVDIAMLQRNNAIGADLSLRVLVDDAGLDAELTDYRNDPAYLPLAGTGSNWINLTLTYSGTLFRIYKNGIVVVEKTISGNKGSGIGPTFRVGVAGGYYYKGNMDDILIYNTALSASDVMKIFEQTQTKY